MNIISYDIELKKKNGTKEEILNVINQCIGKQYSFDLSNRASIERSWLSLPYQELITTNSSAFLLFSFIYENVQVFVFKKETINVVSINDLSLTVVALANKEINLILKSSYTKLITIFSSKLKLSVVEGTQVNLYPFDFDKNDVLSPTFYVKADYDARAIKMETRDWIKLLLFIVITAIFIVAYFNTPAEVLDKDTQKSITNNIKEVYSALMSLGLGVVIIELLTNLLIPTFFKSRYPSVLIKNFSNIFENRGISKPKKEKPVDPQLND